MLIPNGAWPPAASVLLCMVAGPDRIGGDAGQHTPEAHGGPLQPSHSWVCESQRHSGCALSSRERKHELAEEYLAKTNITQGVFLILVGRAQAPVWDVSATSHRTQEADALCEPLLVPYPRSEWGQHRQLFFRTWP